MTVIKNFCIPFIYRRKCGMFVVNLNGCASYFSNGIEGRFNDAWERMEYAHMLIQIRITPVL